ncbi:uncharacterized protein G2W53_037729 [Senna tora]|uniref:Uncharacterized protein n=1 Tax=Senna tora TaxID=362788 RepID=A0A834SJU6_9FABA|nr:uncharacterized protein G2W53_037729 [Senna tora]
MLFNYGKGERVQEQNLTEVLGLVPLVRPFVISVLSSSGCSSSSWDSALEDGTMKALSSFTSKSLSFLFLLLFFFFSKCFSFLGLLAVLELSAIVLFFSVLEFLDEAIEKNTQ